MQPTGATPLRPDDPPEIGTYRLLGRLGEGGMGTVYLATAGERLVALKVVRSTLADDAFAARFHGEVENARKVASFCTAQVLDNGNTADGRPYMVTEYIAGTPLNRQITESGPLDAGPLHGVALGVAAALAAIHVAGLVHRDLKPANVMLSLSGPRVIDFGIARALDASHDFTQAGELLGSPGWWAPEQVRGEPVTPWTDIFAWGCLVAYAGTGRHPYGQGNMMTLAARVLNGRPDLGSLPSPLNDLVKQATDPDPTRRPTAQDLLIALVGGALPPVSARAPETPRAEPLMPVEELNRTLQETFPADEPEDGPADPPPSEEAPSAIEVAVADQAPDSGERADRAAAFTSDDPDSDEQADRTTTFAVTGGGTGSREPADRASDKATGSAEPADQASDSGERADRTATFATTDKGTDTGEPTSGKATNSADSAEQTAADQGASSAEPADLAADHVPGSGERADRIAVLASAEQVPSSHERADRTAVLAAADEIPSSDERADRTAVLASADQVPNSGQRADRTAAFAPTDKGADTSEPADRTGAFAAVDKDGASGEIATSDVPRIDRTAVFAAADGGAASGEPVTASAAPASSADASTAAISDAESGAPLDEVPLVRPPRSRSDRWLIAAVVVFAAFVVSVGVLIVSGDNAPRTAVQIAAQQAADGDVAKRVTVGAGFGVDLVVTRDPQCGLQDFEGVTASAGAFCVIPWSMVNTGGELAAIAAAPVLLDDSGVTHQPHRLSTPLPSGLRPGGRSDGMLVFDLPDDRSPARLQFGGGLEVAL
ncbi:protein kinase domain-containing protein [Herbidospora mongoliensis]|uniref:protein kinase domain-containing protein n=1 Tax=Herbidospora mongoliensis TaxID=688067 RepID=UPI0008358295|nr:protein kinase [Herbidospora mongoliensis]